MREDSHECHEDHYLLDENLTKMEKEGRCVVIKMGEKFFDEHSGLAGFLYVIEKKDISKDFEPVPLPEPAIVVEALRDDAMTARVARRADVAAATTAAYEEWTDNVSTNSNRNSILSH